MTALEHFDECFPGRFIKVSTLKGEPTTYTIKNVYRELLDGEEEQAFKAILSFEETALEYVLPKLNGVAIKAMFGSNVQEWIGKRVTFFATAEIMPMRRGEPCIRVYGSPDIKADVRCEWKPPRRNKITQILKAVQTERVAAALAKVKAATDQAALAKLSTHANALATEKAISPPELERIKAAIILKDRKLSTTLPASALPVERNDGNDRPPVDAADAPAAPATGSGDGGSTPAAAPTPTPSPELTLAGKQALTRTIKALPAKAQERLMDAILKEFDFTVIGQLTTEAHASFVNDRDWNADD